MHSNARRGGGAQLVKDSRMVAGGGACELRLAAHLNELAEKTPGLEQA